MGRLLKNEGLKAKAEWTAASEDAFQAGKLLGYSEVISLMLNKGIAFAIEPVAVGLDEFDTAMNFEVRAPQGLSYGQSF